MTSSPAIGLPVFVCVEEYVTSAIHCSIYFLKRAEIKRIRTKIPIDNSVQCYGNSKYCLFLAHILQFCPYSLFTDQYVEPVMSVWVCLSHRV